MNSVKRRLPAVSPTSRAAKCKIDPRGSRRLSFLGDTIDIDDSDDEAPAAPSRATQNQDIIVVDDSDDESATKRAPKRSKVAARPPTKNSVIVIMDDSDDEPESWWSKGSMAKVSGKPAPKDTPCKIAPTPSSRSQALLPSIASITTTASRRSASSSSSLSSVTHAPSSAANSGATISPTAHFRPGRRLSLDERAILETAFLDNKFPSNLQRTALAKQVGVTPERLRTWFNNRRGIWRKENNLSGDRKFSEDILSVLNVRFAEDDFPTTLQQLAIATETGLTLQQVRNWFNNRRIRHPQT
ncbi:hypothetical protein DFH09DRAFT_1473907 [Mycena vulgaris]|nr:hypothetical protein DFH09DRAFT_1473907 [Mycena vulgaris]